MNTFDLGEAERLSRRESVQEELAAISQKRDAIRELRASINDIDAAADDAANVHVAECEPLQTALHKAKDPGERSIIHRQLAQQNVKLETRVSELNAERKELQKQIGKLEKSCAGSQALQNKLIQLASPALLIDRWVIDRSVKFANQRLTEATSRANGYAESIREAQRAGDKSEERRLSRYLARWKAEQTVAMEAHQAAVAASNSIQAKLAE
ncbi:hypothetical protein NHH03_16820 [Stieleria sp. TO1_6]|uniref:hypothetical protein n=1 Tax=Stieleria tagensis TaxID=2956795 RepID=UPI00209A979D|nr:hypothetical protein [Stieleria tagensis]MCO8123415.1 hypothetical protein [Stieleria tagensis]